MKINNINLKYHSHNSSQPHLAMFTEKLPFHELTIVLSGKMTYIVEGKEVVINTSDAILIKSYTERSRIAGRNADYISFNFTCDNDLSSIQVLNKNFVDQELKLLIASYDEHFQNSNIKSIERFFLYLELILTKLLDFSQKSNYNKLTDKILYYIHNNLDKKITYQSVSEYTNFSPIYCENVFKKDLEISIIQYSNQMKVRQAKYALKENYFSLTQIAENLGFDDYNYFARLFKKTCGYSPIKYRNRFISKFKKQR